MSQFRVLVENILDEARNAGLLYHGTYIKRLAGILKTNSLCAPRNVGISTSRSKHFFISSAFEACLVLDGNKISEHYRLLPFRYPEACDSAETVIQTDKKALKKLGLADTDDYHNWLIYLDDIEGDEAEYNQTGSELKNIRKYIIKILIKSNVLQSTNPNIKQFLNEVITLCNTYNIEIEYVKTK